MPGEILSCVATAVGGAEDNTENLAGLGGTLGMHHIRIASLMLWYCYCAQTCRYNDVTEEAMFEWDVRIILSRTRVRSLLQTIYPLENYSDDVYLYMDQFGELV